MNYLILKSVIDTTIKNYNANRKDNRINANHIFIKSVSNAGIELVIKCPHTGKNTTVQAQINVMHTSGANTEVFSGDKERMPKNAKKVDDSDVMSVRQALKQSSSLEDLL